MIYSNFFMLVTEYLWDTSEIMDFFFTFFSKAFITCAVPHLYSLIKSHRVSLVSVHAVPWAASEISAPNTTAPPKIQKKQG